MAGKYQDTARLLFKIGGPIVPEDRLIGRETILDDLDFAVRKQRAHTWLVGVRRIGKTSLALAVVERHRDAEGGWALHVDLSSGISSCAQLAERIAELARAAGVKASAAERTAKARRGLKAGAKLIKENAATLGLPDELADAAKVAERVNDALGPVEEDTVRDLREVLVALEAASDITGKPIVVFIDEIQRVRNTKKRGQRKKEWDDAEDGLAVQRALAGVMQGTGSAITFILAGSDGDAIAELRAEGMPLHHDGSDFEVPDIGDDDWIAGITDRFAEVDIPIAPEQITEVLKASKRHSQRTMSVFHHLHQIVERERAAASPAGGDTSPLIDEQTVRDAIARAEGHPSWKD